MSLCSTCNGACCRWFLLPGPWLAQLPADVETWYRLHGASELRGVAVDRPCRALDMDTGRCTIYETRPQMCRIWPVGSAGCLESRAMLGPLSQPPPWWHVHLAALRVALAEDLRGLSREQRVVAELWHLGRHPLSVADVDAIMEALDVSPLPT